MARRILIVVPAVLLAAAGWYAFAGHQAPAGQPPLADISVQSIELLKAEFNRDAGELRIILLLSPT